MTDTHNSQTELFTADDNIDALLEHIDILSDDPKCWPKTLHDHMAVIEAAIKRYHPTLASTAHDIARTAIIAVAHYLGGRQLYLPRDDRLQKALRDYTIYHKEFDGKNHEALASAHGLTTIQIYNIIATQHKLHIARIQPPLF